MTLLCPAGCGGARQGPVFGIGPFEMSSDVCAAAIFGGAINASSGGWISVAPTPRALQKDFTSGMRNGIRAQARSIADSIAESRGFGLVIEAASGPSRCRKLWQNFGLVDFKTLGMKLWANMDGDGVS